MDFKDGINVVYGDGQKREDAYAADEFLNEIPVSVRGDGALELELSTVNDNCVSLDPRKGSVWYEGIENIDSEKYSSKLTVSNSELGKRPVLFIHEKSDKQRWVRMFLQPQEKGAD